MLQKLAYHGFADSWNPDRNARAESRDGFSGVAKVLSRGSQMRLGVKANGYF
eukprot:CAMPEP_0114571102 /NCGR_PEP_ID=MMETSP0114-20121206/17570_1 /TAXON_ID=31324 /ORGANISM="Goniomonas sp, Strain m" /LENGTH=51 /DNA_ID=CAMNT_0001758205 /DNA_START=39 /DNA_END=194 /DNA_ORIENTATION=+